MVNRPLRLALFLAIVGGAAAPAQAQTTALFFDSQPGDYIGLGLTQTWTPAQLTFSASASSLNAVTISASNFGGPNPTWWTISLRAPGEAALTAGPYERAQRPFSVDALPGLDVSGSGRGCGVVTGRFVIHEITFSGSTLTSLSADFEQHCENASPALFGAIRFNAQRSSLNPFDGDYPTYALTISPADNGYVTGSGIDCGAGRADCQEAFLASTLVALTPTASPGYVFLGWAGDCFGSTAILIVDRPRLCIPVFNSEDGTGPESPDYSNGAVFVDQTGTTIARRQRSVYPSSLAEIRVTGTAAGISVFLEGEAQTNGSFEFLPPVGGALSPGDYPYAAGDSTSRGGLPGLDTSYCGDGGRFRIYELTFAGSTITSFAADLEQRCGSNGSETLVVAIRYQATRASLLPFDGAYPLRQIGVQASVGGRVAGLGLDCGSGGTDCDEAFSGITTILLQALPSAGYEFLGWAGACFGGDSSVSVIVDRTRHCFAYFQPTQQSGAPPDPTFGARMLFLHQPGAFSARRRVWTAQNASFSFFGFQGELQLNIDGSAGSASLTFAAPAAGGSLVPGYYEEAYSNPNSKFPELRVSSCSATRGRFVIYELTTNSNGQVLTFAADFELQCAGNGPMYGAVRYNSTRNRVNPFDGAFPAYTLSITPSVRGRVTGAGIDCGAGQTDCTETYSSSTAISLTATPASGNIFLGWRGGCDGGASTSVAVSGPTRCAAMFVVPTGTAGTEEPSLSQGALLIDSEAGDPVGGGRRHIWSADADVTANSFSRNRVSLNVIQPDGQQWRLEFSAPNGLDLIPGLYENAINASSATISPGLSVSGPSSSSCFDLSGRFQIHEVVIQAGSFGQLSVARFAADFEQRCANSTGKMQGAIRFNSSRPNLIPFATTSLPHRNIILGLSSFTTGGWIATRNGTAAAASSMPWTRLPWDSYNASGRGVRVAAGDVDGDGLDELVVGVDSGGQGWLAVLDDGAHNFALLKWIQLPWPAYNAQNGAVWPAVGDVDGDGRAEIVAGLGDGGAGYFAVFDDAAGNFNFLTWKQLPWPTYNGGAGSTRPAVADLDGDGAAEIIVGLGPGSNGWIAVFSDADGNYAHETWIRVPWNAYGLTNGETFIAAGDLDGDGSAEIVAGLGVGGAGYLFIFDDANAGFNGIAWRRASWTGYTDSPLHGQVYPAVGDLDGDGRAEIVLGLSPHTDGGWFEILDDNGANNTSLGWRNVGWPAFSAYGGGVLPAIGRLW